MGQLLLRSHPRMHVKSLSIILRWISGYIFAGDWQGRLVWRERIYSSEHILVDFHCRDKVIPFPSFLFPHSPLDIGFTNSLPLIGPVNPARGYGERCITPAENAFLCIFLFKTNSPDGSLPLCNYCAIQVIKLGQNAKTTGQILELLGYLS